MKKVFIGIIISMLASMSLDAAPRVSLFCDCLEEKGGDVFRTEIDRKVEPFGVASPGVSMVYNVDGVKAAWHVLSKLEDVPEIVLICCHDTESNPGIVKRVARNSRKRGYDILWFTIPGGIVSAFHMPVADIIGFKERYPSADEIALAGYLAESTAQWWVGMAGSNPDVRRIPLWNGLPPHYESLMDEMVNSIGRIDQISIPELEVFLPLQEKESPAVIFIPGGGLSYTGFLRNARELSALLNPKGIAVVGVKYRTKRGEDIAFEDVTRAVRLVRYLAETLKINPNEVGIGGQSAGALLALHLTSKFDMGNEDSVDPVERQSCRPDFSVLLTSWNMGLQTSSFEFSEQTPPVFLRHAKDDSGFALAKDIVKSLKSAGVSLDFRFTDGGGHGAFELGSRDGGYGWPEELVSWLEDLGIMDVTGQ